MPHKTAALLAALVAGAGLGGWFVGWQMRRAARQAAERRLPQDYLAGLNFLITEQPDRAVEVFTRMVDVDNEMVEIHFALGSLFRRRGEVDRAIRVHQSILDRQQLTPAHGEQALLELATDYLRAGLLDRSEQLYLRLAESRDYCIVALRALTGIYEQQRDWQQAITMQRRLLASGGAVQPTAVAHYLCELAEAARAQGDDTQARALLREARRERRRFPRAAVLRAELAQAMGDDQLATRLLLIALDREPMLLLEVLPRLQASGRRLKSTAALASAITTQRRDSARHTTVAQALILADVLDEPAALAAVREYLLSDTLLRELVQPAANAAPLDDATLVRLARVVGRVLARGPRYRCGNCGFASQTWFWQCPGCKTWDALRLRLEASEAAALG